MKIAYICGTSSVCIVTWRDVQFSDIIEVNIYRATYETALYLSIYLCIYLSIYQHWPVNRSQAQYPQPEVS